MDENVVPFPATFEPYVTSKKLQEDFSVSEATVRRWAARGCPHIGSGKLRRFRISEVEQWLKGGDAAA